MFFKDGTIPYPISTDNAEFKILQTIIKCQLEGGETYKWNKFDNTSRGVSEYNSTKVHHL